MKIDRKIIGENEARKLAESKKKGLFGKEELHCLGKVIYPALRIDYTYKDVEGFIKKSKVTKRNHFFVDGLLRHFNAKGGIPNIFSPYINGLENPLEVSDKELGKRFKLGPVITEENAKKYINTRLEVVEEEIQRKKEELLEKLREYDEKSTYGASREIRNYYVRLYNETLDKYQKYDGKELIDKLKDEINLPKHLKFEDVIKIEDVDTIYLPFWVAIYEKNDSRRYFTFRDNGKNVEWVSELFVELPELTESFEDFFL